MATTDIERLIVQLSADVRGYKKALDRASRDTDRAARGIETRFNRMNRTVNSGFSKLGAGLKGFGAGLLAGFSVERVVSGIGEIISSVAKLHDEAKRAGVSAEDLQAFGVVAQASGAGVDELADALTKLNVKVAEAKRTGKGALVDLFAANNLTFSDKPIENLLKISELLRNAKSEIDKASIASAAFGARFGAQFIQFLEQGNDKLREGAQAARDSGAVIEEELVNSADDFDDAWNATMTRFKAYSARAVLGVGSELKKLFTDIPGLDDFLAKIVKIQTQLLIPGGIGIIDQFERVQKSPLETSLEQAQEKADKLQATFDHVSKDPNAPPKSIELAKKALDEAIAKAEELRQKLKLSGATGPTISRNPFDVQRGTPTIVPSSLDEAGDNLNKAAQKLDSAVDNFVRDQTQLRDQQLIEEFRKLPPAGDALKAPADKLDLSADGLTQSSTDLTGSATNLDTSASGLNTAAQNLTNAANTMATTIIQPAAALSGAAGALSNVQINSGILDLIAKRESNRNFNATVFNGKFTGGESFDLVNKSIREVLEIQRRMLASPLQNPNAKTSAVGAFQITKTTLEDFTKRLNISLDEKFTPELQTKIAEAIVASTKGNVAALRGRFAGLEGVPTEDILQTLNASTTQLVSAQTSLVQATNKQAQSAADIAAETKANAAKLTELGIAADDAALSLAQVLGPEGAAKILQAPSGTRVADVLTPQEIQKAPDVLGRQGETVDQVIALAKAHGGLTAELEREKQARDDILSTGQEQIADLEAERQALGLTAHEADKLSFATEKLNQLRQAGVAITPEVTAAIDQLAEKYADERDAIRGVEEAQTAAAQSAEQLAAAQAQTQQTIEAIGGAFEGALQGFINDLIQGKDLTDALRDALINLGQSLLNIALDNLFSGLGGGAGAGGLFGKLFHEGSTAAGTGGPSRRVSRETFLGAPRYHSGGFAGLKPGEIPAILKQGEPIGPEAIDAAAKKLISLGALKFIKESNGQQINVSNQFIIPTERAAIRTQNQIAQKSADALSRARRVA